MKLKNIIQSYLDDQNHNWSWLSEETGLSRSVTYGIKNEVRENVTLRNITKISVALNIDMNDFKRLIKTEKA